MAHLQSLCLMVTMVVSFSYQVAISSDQEYFGILVDAGSSSSKVKLYQWSPPKSIYSMPVVRLVNSTKFRTPISDFSDDLEGLSMYIDDILDWGVDAIPESQHSTTPILIQATAGMRFQDSERTENLLQEVREILSNASRSPFAPIRHDDVSVLSGEEEAVYAWIAANYLLDFFDGNKPVDESVGILEMGGGSTQIAFIPEGPLYDGEFQVRLANRRYSLYAQSYLNLGATAINREIIHQLLSEEATQPDHLPEPCMFKGDNKTVSLGNGVSMEVYGDSNATWCTGVLYEVLKPSEGIECQPKPCAIRQVYQPSIGDGKFYATSAFSYAPKTLQAVRKDGSLNIGKMQTNAKELCDLTLDEASEKHPERSKYITSDCLMGNYVPLLFQNYGFDLDTNQIILSSKIGSQKIDWAVGAMLMKLSDKFAGSQGTFSIQCPRSVRANNGASSARYPWGTTQQALALFVPLVFLLVNIIH